MLGASRTHALYFKTVRALCPSVHEPRNISETTKNLKNSTAQVLNSVPVIRKRQRRPGAVAGDGGGPGRRAGPGQPSTVVSRR
jgi:hypothetical protein